MPSGEKLGFARGQRPGMVEGCVVGRSGYWGKMETRRDEISGHSGCVGRTFAAVSIRTPVRGEGKEENLEPRTTATKHGDAEFTGWHVVVLPLHYLQLAVGQI